jgi:arginine/lysine/ornithine decarboxylase
LKPRSTITFSKNKLSQNIDAYLNENYAQFHSPAHCGLLNTRDLSEVEGLDDLQEPQGVLKHYHDECAELFGAQASFFLINGASVGLQAACLALKIFLEENKNTKPVLVARNIHKSVLSGIILAGLKIKWLEPAWDEDLGIYTKVSVPEKPEDHYSALIITNPSYEGFYSEIPKLKIPLIVDEAHGAHYNFSDKLPESALQYGADIVIQSWHKTLGSLTQTGVIHVGKNSLIKAQYIQACLKLLQTTSPSYLLLESLCQIIEDYKSQGKEIIEATIEKSSLIKQYRIENDDPFRCLLKVPDYKGQELDEILFSNNISVEEVLESSVLAFINPGNTLEDINTLVNTLHSIKTRTTLSTKSKKPLVQKGILDPRKEFFKNQDTEIKAPCPPGIITKYPGDEN